MSKDILQEIIANKRLEVAEAMRRCPIEALRERLSEGMAAPQSPFKLSRRLAGGGVISEFKRRSPSKGWIHPDALPGRVAPAYMAAGAAAISVLTDTRYFGAREDDFPTVRQLVDIPLLRKDFIIDRYQLYESRLMGADAVLLIASALHRELCGELAAEAHTLGMEVLLEIHTPAELAYVTDDIKIVGVNNRNLGTFHTDTANSRAMASMLPPGKILVSESGIDSPDAVRRLRADGFSGFLIGEALMRHVDPGEALIGYIGAL